MIECVYSTISFHSQTPLYHPLPVYNHKARNCPHLRDPSPEVVLHRQLHNLPVGEQAVQERMDLNVLVYNAGPMCQSMRALPRGMWYESHNVSFHHSTHEPSTSTPRCVCVCVHVLNYCGNLKNEVHSPPLLG